jgi:hypothetical protein
LQKIDGQLFGLFWGGAALTLNWLFDVEAEPL